LARKREAFESDAPRVSNGQHYDFCPDCKGTGRCPDCPDGVCVLCSGMKITTFVDPQTGDSLPYTAHF